MKGVLSNKLKYLRTMAGINQRDLAERIGVSSEYISLIESGKRTPSLNILYKIVGEFNVDINYLTSERQTDFSIILRSEGLDENDKIQLNKFLKLAGDYHFLEKITDNYYVPAPFYQEFIYHENLSKNKLIKNAEKISHDERSRLGLGNQPIKDIFRLIETQGVHVIRQPLNSNNISGAFLYSAEMGAYILVNSGMSYGRQVFTAAHEYYHYIVDRNKGPLIDVMDLEASQEPNELMANVFASSFLMPNSSIRNILTLFPEPEIQPENIIYLKRYFDVSYEAMLYRLKVLDLISEQDVKIFKKVKPKKLEKRLYGDSTENIIPKYIPDRYFTLSLTAYNMGAISISRLTELWKNFIDIDAISVRDIVSSSNFPEGETLIGDLSD